MWDLLNILWDYWFLIVWLLATILAFLYGGPKLGFLVLSLGGGLAAYLLGKKAVRDSNQKAVQDIQLKRERAYEKIDSRNTDHNDILDRLRNGSY
jgi:hypothetical protein